MKRKPAYSDDPAWLLERMKKYCAFQERCIYDVKRKLKEWNIREEVVDRLIARLIKEDYINEERFARIFAGGKFRNNKWGKNRIIRELETRNIPDIYIQVGLHEIGDEEYITTLRRLIYKKNKELDIANVDVRNRKLASFAIGKGYEPGLVWDILNYRD